MVAKVFVLSEYFEENFNTANSIGFAGGAVGMIVLAPAMEFLISHFGWRGALMISSAVSLNICLAGVVMKSKIAPSKDDKYCDAPQPEKCSKDFIEDCVKKVKHGVKDNNRKNRLQDKQAETKKAYGTVHKQTENSQNRCCNINSILEKLGFATLAREPQLSLYLAAFALQEVAVTGWMLFLFTYTTLLGFDKQIATFFSSVGGLGTLFGRLFAGPCTDRGVCSPRGQIGLFAFGGCANLLLYPFVSNYWGLIVLSFLTGLFVGTTSPTYVTLLKDMFADNSVDFSGSVSLHFTMRGIGMLCGGPLTGNDIMPVKKCICSGMLGLG